MALQGRGSEKEADGDDEAGGRLACEEALLGQPA
jgi:hypothetical protein